MPHTKPTPASSQLLRVEFFPSIEHTSEMHTTRPLWEVGTLVYPNGSRLGLHPCIVHVVMHGDSDWEQPFTLFLLDKPASYDLAHKIVTTIMEAGGKVFMASGIVGGRHFPL